MDTQTAVAEASSVREVRAAQMFPTLAGDEITRIRRFGQVQHYAAGEMVARTGQAGLGLGVILSGEVRITQGKYGYGGVSKLDLLQSQLDLLIPKVKMA